MLAKADIKRKRGPSDLELRALDPLPEIGAGRLLQRSRIGGVEPVEGDEIVLVLVRGEALDEGLVGDVILAPAALAAEAFHLEAFHGADHVVDARPAAFRLR